MGVDIHELIQELEWYQKNQIPDIQPEYLDDIITVLKAQEPVEYVVHCKNADLSNGTEFACGECGGSLLHKKVNYCPWCGRGVRWT
jgi:hypothetical protein